MIGRWPAFVLMTLSCTGLARADTIEQQLATILYGQTDPDHILARGLHGTASRTAPVTITSEGPCRYRLATAGASEVIDLSRGPKIRVTLVADRRSLVMAGLDPVYGTRTPIVRRVQVELLERPCPGIGCRLRRTFVIHDPSKFGRVRLTAAAFRAPACDAFPLSQQPQLLHPAQPPSKQRPRG